MHLICWPWTHCLGEEHLHPPSLITRTAVRDQANRSPLKNRGIPQWAVSFLNTLRARQNGRHFADDMFKCIFLNENVWILIKISLKFVPKGPNNNNPALFQIMAWRRPGDKPLSEPMMVSLPMHKCVVRPQWVKQLGSNIQTVIRLKPLPVQL